MAELRIDGYIGQESGLASLLGDGSSFNLNRLEDFLDTNEESALKIKINSGGGSVTEGFAIHDRIVSSGLEIETEVLGMCGSIATIIALSAPKGKRKGHANSEYFIHNPFWQPMSPDPMEATDLTRLARELKDAEERILNFYVEKTGAPKAQIKRLMDEKTSMTMQTAKRLGFIDEIVTEQVTDKKYAVLAYVDSKKQTNMATPKFSAEEKTWLEKQFAAIEAKFTKAFTPVKIKNMVIKLDDGKEIFVESEDGEYVGKKVFESDMTTPAPDGEYKLEDGRVLVTVGGVCTEVKEMEAVANPDEIAALTAQLKTANEKLAAIEAEKQAAITASAEVKKEVEALKTEKAETEKVVTEMKTEILNMKNIVLGVQPVPAAQGFKGAEPTEQIMTGKSINIAAFKKFKDAQIKK